MHLNTYQRLGVFYDLPAAEYHADPAVSNSMLSMMAKSPAHCWAMYFAPGRPEREETEAMKIGTLAHCAILEPKQFKSRYIVRPPGMSFVTKEGKAWRDSVSGSVTIISDDDHRAAIKQRDAVLAIEQLAKLFSTGRPEVSLFWIDKHTGLRCKARVDWWADADRIALDLKSIADLTPDNVMRAVTRYGYHRQRAHYLAGLNACGLKPFDFGFVFVSSSYPFIATPYLLDDETAAQGVEEVEELIDRLAECQKSGRWPAFGDGFQVTGLTKWARRTQEVEVSYAD